MDKGSGKDKSDAHVGEPEAQDAPVPGTDESSGHTRRTFSRASLAGSAVLLTLGNRSAWGAMGNWMPPTKKGKGKDKKDEKICVSTMILESFQMASHFDHHKKDKKFIHYMKHVDLDMNPEPGYSIVIQGRESCIIGPKH